MTNTPKAQPSVGPEMRNDPVNGSAPDCMHCARSVQHENARLFQGLISCEVSEDLQVVQQAAEAFRRCGEVAEPFRVVRDRTVRVVAWPMLFEPAAIKACSGYVTAALLRPKDGRNR